MSDLPPKFAIALHTLAMERHVLNEPKTLTVQVEEIGMFGERLETENLAFNPVRAGGKLRIDWSREVDIAPGGRAWDALDATLREIARGLEEATVGSIARQAARDAPPLKQRL